MADLKKALEFALQFKSVEAAADHAAKIREGGDEKKLKGAKYQAIVKSIEKGGTKAEAVFAMRKLGPKDFAVLAVDFHGMPLTTLRGVVSNPEQYAVRAKMEKLKLYEPGRTGVVSDFGAQVLNLAYPNRTYKNEKARMKAIMDDVYKEADAKASTPTEPQPDPKKALPVVPVKAKYKIALERLTPEEKIVLVSMSAYPIGTKPKGFPGESVRTKDQAALAQRYTKLTPIEFVRIQRELFRGKKREGQPVIPPVTLGGQRIFQQDFATKDYILSDPGKSVADSIRNALNQRTHIKTLQALKKERDAVQAAGGPELFAKGVKAQTIKPPMGRPAAAPPRVTIADLQKLMDDFREVFDKEILAVNRYEVWETPRTKKAYETLRDDVIPRLVAYWNSMPKGELAKEYDKHIEALQDKSMERMVITATQTRAQFLLPLQHLAAINRLGEIDREEWKNDKAARLDFNSLVLDEKAMVVALAVHIYDPKEIEIYTGFNGREQEDALKSLKDKNIVVLPRMKGNDFTRPEEFRAQIDELVREDYQHGVAKGALMRFAKKTHFPALYKPHQAAYIVLLWKAQKSYGDVTNEEFYKVAKENGYGRMGVMYAEDARRWAKKEGLIETGRYDVGKLTPYGEAFFDYLYSIVYRGKTVPEMLKALQPKVEVDKIKVDLGAGPLTLATSQTKAMTADDTGLSWEEEMVALSYLANVKKWGGHPDYRRFMTTVVLRLMSSDEFDRGREGLQKKGLVGKRDQVTAKTRALGELIKKRLGMPEGTVQGARDALAKKRPGGPLNIQNQATDSAESPVASAIGSLMQSPQAQGEDMIPGSLRVPLSARNKLRGAYTMNDAELSRLVDDFIAGKQYLALVHLSSILPQNPNISPRTHDGLRMMLKDQGYDAFAGFEEAMDYGLADEVLQIIGTATHPGKVVPFAKLLPRIRKIVTDDGKWENRYAAIRILNVGRDTSDEAMAQLEKALEDQDERVRGIAKKTLEKLGKSSGVLTAVDKRTATEPGPEEKEPPRRPDLKDLSWGELVALGVWSYHPNVDRGMIGDRLAKYKVEAPATILANLEKRPGMITTEVPGEEDLEGFETVVPLPSDEGIVLWALTDLGRSVGEDVRRLVGNPAEALKFRQKMQEFIPDRESATSKPKPAIFAGREEKREASGLWHEGENRAADALVLLPLKGIPYILLIQRRDGTYALPGGFVEGNKPGAAAAADASREEVEQETGLSLPPKAREIGYYSDKGRDPRSTGDRWVSTRVFAYHMPDASNLPPVTHEGDPDGGARHALWVTIPETRRLNFYADHAKILKKYLEDELRNMAAEGLLLHDVVDEVLSGVKSRGKIPEMKLDLSRLAWTEKVALLAQNAWWTSIDEVAGGMSHAVDATGIGEDEYEDALGALMQVQMGGEYIMKPVGRVTSTGVKVVDALLAELQAKSVPEALRKLKASRPSTPDAKADEADLFAGEGRDIGQKLRISIRRPDQELTNEELTARIKHDVGPSKRQESWSFFVQRRSLKPGIDAKEYWAIWDKVRPNPHEREIEVTFEPTHKETLTGAEVMVIRDKESRGGYLAIFASGATSQITRHTPKQNFVSLKDGTPFNWGFPPEEKKAPASKVVLTPEGKSLSGEVQDFLQKIDEKQKVALLVAAIPEIWSKANARDYKEAVYLEATGGDDEDYWRQISRLEELGGTDSHGVVTEFGAEVVKGITGGRSPIEFLHYNKGVTWRVSHYFYGETLPPRLGPAILAILLSRSSPRDEFQKMKWSIEWVEYGNKYLREQNLLDSSNKLTKEGMFTAYEIFASAGTSKLSEILARLDRQLRLDSKPGHDYAVEVAAPPGSFEMGMGKMKLRKGFSSPVSVMRKKEGELPLPKELEGFKLSGKLASVPKLVAQMFRIKRPLKKRKEIYEKLHVILREELEDRLNDAGVHSAYYAGGKMSDYRGGVYSGLLRVLTRKDALGKPETEKDILMNARSVLWSAEKAQAMVDDLIAKYGKKQKEGLESILPHEEPKSVPLADVLKASYLKIVAGQPYSAAVYLSELFREARKLNATLSVEEFKKTIEDLEKQVVIDAVPVNDRTMVKSGEYAITQADGGIIDFIMWRETAQKRAQKSSVPPQTSKEPELSREEQVALLVLTLKALNPIQKKEKAYLYGLPHGKFEDTLLSLREKGYVAQGTSANTAGKDRATAIAKELKAKDAIGALEKISEARPDLSPTAAAVSAIGAPSPKLASVGSLSWEEKVALLLIYSTKGSARPGAGERMAGLKRDAFFAAEKTLIDKGFAQAAPGEKSALMTEEGVKAVERMIADSGLQYAEQLIKQMSRKDEGLEFSRRSYSDPEAFPTLHRLYIEEAEKQPMMAGNLTISELYDGMVAKGFSNDVEKFKSALLGWMKERKLTLWVVDSPRLEPRSKTDGIPSDRGLLYFVRMPREGTPGAPAPAPSAPTSQPTDPDASKPSVSAAKKKYTLDFDKAGDKRKSFPYVARLFLDDRGAVKRDFKDLNREYLGKYDVRVYGRYTVEEGEVLEIQEGEGSWRDKDRHIYIVLAGEERYVGKATDVKVHRQITEYLGGKIEVEDIAFKRPLIQPPQEDPRLED